MLQVVAVPPEAVGQVWSMAEPFLLRATEESYGTITIDWVKNKCLSGTGNLFFIRDIEANEIVATILCHIYRQPGGRRDIEIILASGDRLDEWCDDFLAYMEVVAQDNNCEGILLTGRRGWQRKLKHNGYMVLQTTMWKSVARGKPS